MDAIFVGEFKPGWYAQSSFDDVVEVECLGDFRSGHDASEYARFSGKGTPKYCATREDVKSIFGV